MNIEQLKADLAEAQVINKKLEMIVEHTRGERDASRALAEKLRLLLNAAKCPNCDGSGATVKRTRSREYVSRSMALDAGDPSLEGSLYCDDEFEQEQCQWCAEKSLRESDFVEEVMIRGRNAMTTKERIDQEWIEVKGHMVKCDGAMADEDWSKASLEANDLSLSAMRLESWINEYYSEQIKSQA